MRISDGTAVRAEEGALMFFYLIDACLVLLIFGVSNI